MSTSLLINKETEMKRTIGTYIENMIKKERRLYNNTEFLIQQLGQFLFVIVLPIVGAFLDPTVKNGMACPVWFLFGLFLTCHVVWQQTNIRTSKLANESLFRCEMLFDRKRVTPAGIFIDLLNESLHMIEVFTNIIFTIFM